MGDKFDKFPITPDIERDIIARYQANSVSICYVSSARAIAARYTVCDERKLLTAVRAGSCHAIDWSTYYEDRMSDNNCGRATRLTFNVDTITAWGRNDAAFVAAARQENAARLNAFRATHMNQNASATSYSATSVPSSVSSWIVNER